MHTTSFPADAIARYRQLESHHRTAHMANKLMDALRGRVHNVRIVSGNGRLELHGTCKSSADVHEVLETARHLMLTDVQVTSMLEVIEN